ncbi:MAG: serine/threonine-protein kinase [Planctomycetota bacterium]
MDTPEVQAWQRARAWLERLRDLSPEEREAALQRDLADQPALADEVRALLEADRGTQSRLDVTAMDVCDHLERPAPSDALIGHLVDGWRLVAVLGDGGTATVFRGVREPDGGRVAIKVLKPEGGGRAFLQRFVHEYEALRGLEHPGLVPVLDAGELEDGRPYLISELVEGNPLQRFCAERQPTREQRLLLFVEICRAVHYAHQSLVVHRDLKPTNIVVETASGRPRVLDFGIAKLLDPVRDPAWTDAYGPGPMTLAFASPEQICGAPITTAGDVYSLGVVLYWLLAGKTPFADAADRQGLERAILEREPAFPASLPTELARVLRCALQKEATARYPSAEHLADDVERFLQHRPVRAGQDPPWRAAMKLLRRHPLKAAVAGGLLCLLLGGWLGARRSLDQLRRTEAVAWRAHGHAAQTTRVLSDLMARLGAREPSAQPALRRLLDDGEQQLPDLRDAPEAEARLRMALGELARTLRLPDRATAHYERALDLVRTTPGLSSADENACVAALAALR